jgi:hypothetical protein
MIIVRHVSGGGSRAFANMALPTWSRLWKIGRLSGAILPIATVPLDE